MDTEETSRFTSHENGIERAYASALIGPMELCAQSGGQTDGQAAEHSVKEHLNVAAHGLRGLASLMVVGAHIIGGTAQHIYQNDSSYVETIQHPWYLGIYGVELFFVISGFVILPSALKYRPGEFALRRFFRLYPLFFAFSALFIALNWATNIYHYNNNLKSILSGLLFINLFTGTEQLTPNAWSLTYEVMFYALMCAVVHFTIRSRSTILGSMAVISSLWFVATFPIAIYFVAGVVVRLTLPANKLSGPVNKSIEIISFIIMVILASRAHYEYEPKDFMDPAVITLMLTTAIYFYFAVSPGSLTHRLMDNKSARYAGTISYSLYLVHPYVYYLVRAVFVHEGWFTSDTARSVGIFAIFVFALSIAISHFVHATLERTPYQWVFRQRIYSKATQETEPDAAMATGGRG